MQISGKSIGEVKIVADMHERKSQMAKHADGFIALPGEFLKEGPTPTLNKRLIPNSVFNSMGIFLSSKIFRWIWDYGGAVGDDNMVSAWDT